MRTTRHKLPANFSMQDYEADCDDCGTRYYRSQLKKNSSGFLLCEGCWETGIVGLDRENNEGAKRWHRYRHRGGVRYGNAQTSVTEYDPEVP